MSQPLVRRLSPLISLAALMSLTPACAPEGEDVYGGGTAPVLDEDGDAFTSEDDCNDNDALVFPGAPEDPNADGLGDGLDNDCDGDIDEGTLDGDDDFDGYTEREGDCDDESTIIAPNLQDGCDGLDNDCDDTVDEGADDVGEPNNDRALATSVGDDITCKAKNVYLNLLGTPSDPDTDWLRFEVGNESSIGCAFGVTATLNDLPRGEDVRMRLYRGSSSASVASLDFEAESDGDPAVLQWEGPRSDPGGIFYLEVTGLSGSSYCLDDMRLVLQGMAPPSIPVP